MATHPVLRDCIDRVWAEFRPKEKLPPSEWAGEHRHISGKSGEMSGKFEWALVPFLRAVVDAAFVEPGVHGVRVQKPAQIGYSESVFTNLLLYIIDMIPAPMMALFPKLDKAKEFNLERFEPAVEETPRLREKVTLRSREKGVTQTFKNFPGGWLKFVGSHSADAVKSSSVRYIFVEEPDDCEVDVKGQGSTVKLMRQRLKTYYDTVSIMGGTPTLEGLSAIDDEMALTDKRRWYVPCHHCGDARPLAWENVRWREDPAREHPVYGAAMPETAYYVCPSCGGVWSDAERARNAREAEQRGGGWRATAPFTGIAGFFLDDLMSSFPGAALQSQVEEWLEAQHKYAAGDVKALVEFWNNRRGLPFAYKSPAPKVEELEQRAEDYPELTVPWGGLVLTVGIDVQGDRLVVLIVAWGRGEESWRVYWGEIHGTPSREDDPVWTELEEFLRRPYRHASGAELYVEGLSIDSGDGNTSDAVYAFCRRHRHLMAPSGRRIEVMPTKGYEGGEIYRAPRPIDPGYKTKASRYGLQVYQVGTEKAKDLLIGFGEHGGRLRLAEQRDGRTISGRGPGRMHWYREIRADYFAQVVSEIKAPAKGKPRNKLYWQVKQGAQNHGLDCEVLNLHAARRLKLNLMSEAQWRAREEQLLQPDLVEAMRIESSVGRIESSAGRTESSAGREETPARAPAAEEAPPARTGVPAGGANAVKERALETMRSARGGRAGSSDSGMPY